MFPILNTAQSQNLELSYNKIPNILTLSINSNLVIINRKAVDQLAILSYKLASRIVAIYSSISACFWFTCQRIHCIVQANLRVGLFACLVSESISKPTGQNIYKEQLMLYFSHWIGHFFVQLYSTNLLIRFFFGF